MKAYACVRCIDTGYVLGAKGLYSYEPCPKCRSEERAKWEAAKAKQKEDEE